MLTLEEKLKYFNWFYYITNNGKQKEEWMKKQKLIKDELKKLSRVDAESLVNKYRPPSSEIRFIIDADYVI